MKRLAERSLFGLVVPIASRMSFAALTVTLTAIALTPGALFAQGEIATGQIVGTVSDETGAPLPGAAVTATEIATGRSRTTTAGSEGDIRFSILPSGVYKITGSLSGFADQVVDNVRIAVGAVRKVDFHLRLAGAAEAVTVTGAVPVVESTSPNSTSTVSDQVIADFPLAGRNFTDFVKLTPQAIVTADSRIHVGARGIQNSYNIDGADDNSSFFGEQRGGFDPPFTFSQAAIKEFQVLRSSYNAQFSAVGATINAITKSGTNELNGQVFGYYRADDPNSNAWYKDTYDSRPGHEGEFKSKQFGAALGGPIVKDGVFYFVSADVQRWKNPAEFDYVGHNDPNSPASKFFRDPANAAFVARFIDLDDETGVKIQTKDAESFLGKIDASVGSSGLFTFRDNFSNYDGKNQGSTAPTTGLSNNGTNTNKFNSAVGNLSFVLGGTSTNELIVQYTKEDRPRSANSSTLPEAQIGNNFDFVFGQNQFLPNNLIEKRIQLVDNFTFLAGDHAIKAGIDFSRVNYDDTFFRYQAGFYRFASWQDFKEGKPNRYIQSFSDFDGRVKYASDDFNVYLQDEWRVSPKLTVTAGLRYELQNNPDAKETNPRYSDTGRIPDDRNNWAPRLGFAWDVKGDGRSVVRGGSGIFYGMSPSLLTANALLANGVRVVQIQIDKTSDMPVYPNIFPDLGSAKIVTPNLFVFDHDFENAKTLRSSLGYEVEAAGGVAVGVEAIFAHSTDLERRYDANLGDPSATKLTLDGRPSYSGSPKKNADFNRIWRFTSDAEARYKAVILTARKALSSDWSLLASYTWSQSFDNDSNERNVSGSGNSAEDMNNLRGDWGPSDYDVEHNLVLSSVVTLPKGFQVAFIYNVRSGLPYTLKDSGDLNNDGNNTDRATYCIDDPASTACPSGRWFHASRNGERAPAFQTTDLRLSWGRETWASQRLELIVEGFNLYDSGNRITTDTTITSGGKRIAIGKDANGDPIYKRVHFGKTGDPRQYQLAIRYLF